MSGLELKKAAENSPPAEAESFTAGSTAWGRFKRNRPALFSLWLISVLVVLVFVWPWLLAAARASGPGGMALAQRLDPARLSDARFEPPGARHWFGTDVHGRDQFSRVVYGARISLLVGLVGAAVSLVIGVVWGAVVGYAGGRIDGAMMRCVDALYAMPSIILVIVLTTALEGAFAGWLAKSDSPKLAGSARLLFLFIGLGSVSWLTMARIVRGQVLSLRQRAFVEASRALGAGPWRILTRHIMPNLWGVVIVYLTLTVPAVVLYESFLSYLGLGIQPPMSSWGSLIAEGAEQINPIHVYWWLLVFPGGSLVLALLALNFLGDGLRDAWELAP